MTRRGSIPTKSFGLLSAYHRVHTHGGRSCFARPSCCLMKRGPPSNIGLIRPRCRQFGDANVVEQPEVEVVGLHELEGLFDIAEGIVAAALPGLGTKEGVVAAVLDHAADVLLAPALGESVPGSGVDEVDPKIEASLDDGNGDVEVVGSF